jgi:hypothetical protein
LLAILIVAPASAGVSQININQVENEVFSGKVFGTVGTYKRIVGSADMKIDPADPHNKDIVDINVAKRNRQGLVEYSSPFYILTPSDPARANGKIVYDVVNRGRKAALYLLNDAPLKDNPNTAMDAGNGYLMEQGYTIVFSGWQSDVPNKNGLMGLDAPTIDGITGWVTEEFIFDNSTNPAVAHLTYPVASSERPEANITVKRTSDETGAVPKGLAFRFESADTISIARPADFDAGSIYTFSYKAKSPKVSGLGFAAIRDLVSFLRHPRGPTTVPGLPTVSAAYGVGVSQSGRFLRDLVYWGKNEDEQGRIVFDGILPYVAGSRKTVVNSRFAQAGRFSRQHEDHDFPGDQFPFSYASSYDPLTRRTDGILNRCTQNGTCPKVIQTDSDTENMQGRISLLVTSTDAKPLPIPENVRLFYLAGYPHAALSDAKVAPTATCQFLSNSLHPGIIERALFAALDQWVSKGKRPPDSNYPSLLDGSLVPARDAGYKNIPGLKYEGKFNRLMLKEEGKKSTGLRKEYPVFVAKVDADGIALAGVHTPMVAAPLATYLGWNLRKSGYGEGELCGINGSTIPFAKTLSSRMASGDQRASLAERYPGSDAYVRAVASSVRGLQEQRLLLPADGEKIMQKALIQAEDLR